jgi:hypothetical protein
MKKPELMLSNEGFGGVLMSREQPSPVEEICSLNIEILLAHGLFLAEI